LFSCSFFFVVWTASEPVAVIRRGPNSYESFVEHVLVSFHHQLVCSANEVEFVDIVKLVRKEGKEEGRSQWKRFNFTGSSYLCNNVSSKQVPSSTRTETPPIDFWEKAEFQWREDLIERKKKKKKKKSGVLHLPSGSDQSKSHIAPSWGTSCFLSIARI
jgi:hypothetical protein